MEQAFEAFLASLRDRGYAPRTTLNYARVLRAFSVFVGGVDDPASVGADQVTAFLRARQGAPTTRNAKLAALRSFFRFLERRGAIARSPAEEVEYAREPAKAPTYLTAAEFDAFVGAVRRVSRHAVRDVALVSTLYHSGMRVGELHQLDLAMLSWDRHEFVGVRVKGQRVVNLAFGPGAVPPLRAWIFDRARWRGSETPPLFVSERGGRLSVRAIENLFARWSREAGLPRKITPHGLRHSTATNLLAAGVGIETVADVLGHASLNTTRRYTHLADTRRHEALARLVPADAVREAA